MARAKCKVDEHGRQWRVREFYTTPTGNQTKTFYYGTAAEAEHHKAIFQSERDGRTVGQAVREYIEDLRIHGGTRVRCLTPAGLKMRECKLVAILDLVDRAAARENRGKREQQRVYNDRPIETLTSKAALKLYQDCVNSGLSAATHHGYLVAATGFGEWCRLQGYLPANPFSDVRAILPEGGMPAGKAKLDLDPARKFLITAYEDKHPFGGLACAAMLTLGTRSHELLQRKVSDLDDNGRVLVIRRSKTDAGKRRVQLPPVLRSKLRELAKGQPDDLLLFRGMTNGTLLGHVRRICEDAKVPEVCAHGIRGTWIDLTAEYEQKLEKVAAAAGHADTAVTKRHYMSAGTEQSARAAMMEDLLLQVADERGETDAQMVEREQREAEERLAALKAKKARNERVLKAV
jgi:integrase